MSLLLISLGVALLIQLVLFVPAFIFKTDKLTDMSYGLTFILLALIFLVSGEVSTGKLVLFAMISIWALRLVVYLVVRINKIGKDYRFDGVRENFVRFLTFWVLQGLVVWAVLIPSLLYLGESPKELGLLSYLGLAIWAIGLSIESFADHQKFVFKDNKKNKGKWIESGLWKYSRHPNYFGEALLWVGVYVFVFTGIENKLIGLIGPLVILFILLFGTGVPKLEKEYDKRYKGNKKYQEYKRRTSVFIPWFRKK